MHNQHDDVIQQVRHALALEPRVKGSRISVTMIGPELSLTGILDSPEAVRIAEAVAREAAQGTPIDNGLTVAEVPHGSGPLAIQAAEAFERALEQLAGRPARGGVEVTRHGVAKVHGRCSTAADRRQLIEAVEAIPGLREVDASDLHVAWFGTADDIRLGNMAEERLMNEAPRLADAVRVDVRDRVAHLRGAVREQRDRERAIALIESVPGITRIIDKLRLYRAGEGSDDAALIEQRIKRALAEAGLPAPNLAVFVTQGIATLHGDVDSVDQQRLAPEVARKIDGVSQVENMLVVTARHSQSAEGPGEEPRSGKRS